MLERGSQYPRTRRPCRGRVTPGAGPVRPWVHLFWARPHSGGVPLRAGFAGGTGDGCPAAWQGLGTGRGAGGRRGGRVSAADVCAAVVPAVQVTGAWLSAARDAQAGHLMRVTDEVSERLAELQLTLGEGPSLDASASGGPALASDLADGESGSRWPAFAPAACRAGAAAVFAFPLAVGAIRAGVLGLYRDRPGPLSDFQLGDALVFADTATMLLLDAQDRAGGAAGPGAGPGGQPAGLASLPGGDRPGHRHAHRAARRQHHRRVRAAARLCLCQRPRAGRCRPRHRSAPPEAAPDPDLSLR